MIRSSARGMMFLSIVVLFSVMVIAGPADVYGQDVSITSIGLEETALLKVTNESDEQISMLRIWLGDDYSFKSFKAQDGWVGEKNEYGIIIFTSADPIKPGESVRFGVKTDKPTSKINWKVLNEKDVLIDTGISVPKNLSTEDKNPIVIEDPVETMTSESTFRIVPEKPNAGSSIRVTGDNFGPLQEFDFYIDTKMVGSFETNENGHFMTTMEIPDDQSPDRVDFKVVDKKDKEMIVSLRIGEADDRIPNAEHIPLTIQGVPKIIHRGDFLEIFGTGKPNGAITTTINTSDGDIINARTAEIDSKGDWKLEPIIVALDTPFGKYSATIKDGNDERLIFWDVESDKTILVFPTSLKFDQGETMKFNGTATVNQSIEFILEDPLGNEIASDIVQPDSTGYVEFLFVTTQNTREGTYTLISTQEKEKEITYVGLGQRASIPVNLKFDKLNYKSGETAIITLSGKASEVVSLLVLDPSDNEVGNVTKITLEPDGSATHTIELKGYASGVYTATLLNKKGVNEIFSVGLQTGSGEIKINTIKEDYHPGDPILILGETGANVLLTITMANPDGEIIKTKETFSDKHKKISEKSFRIPTDAKPGMWVIKAQSGSNYAVTEIEVLGVHVKGMIVTVTAGLDYRGYDNTVDIHVVGAKQTVEIEIIAEDGEVIAELSRQASGGGEINMPWLIPKDIVPGIYTFKVSDAFKKAETTFEIQ